MSLAEVNSPMRREPVPPRLADDGRSPRKAGFESLITRTFDPSSTPASKDLGDSRPRNFDIAFNVLKRGAESLDELQARCNQLKAELAATAERHRLELDAARQDAAQWQTIADDLKDKLQWSQVRLADAVDANAQQENRLAAETQRVEAAERRTHAFERIAMAFHDGIMTVFQEAGPSAG